MGDAGHHWVGKTLVMACGCPRVEAQRGSPTTDENSINMYTLKYIMGRGEVEGGWATGRGQGYDWSVAPMEPSLKYKIWNHIGNSLG